VNAVTLAARLVLVAVFAVAGAAKLRDRPGTRLTLEDFGLSERISRPVALLLPLAELTVAGLLLFDATASAGAIGALVLLGAFMAGIAFNLARGRRPDCNCFGQLHSKPAGPATLARNATLAILAALVLAAGRNDAAASALDGLAGLDAATALALSALVLAALALVLGAWVALHLLRQQGRVLLRLDALDGGASASAQMPAPPGLPVGAPAPAFEMPNAGGERIALRQLIEGGRPLVLAFVDPDCAPCRSLLPELAERRGGDVRLAVVISRADPDAARAMASEYALPIALLDPDGSVSDSYDTFGTPAAVAIGPDGLIRSELAGGPDAVRELFDRLDERAGDSFALPIVSVGGAGGRDNSALGEPVPDVELEDTRDGPVSLRAAAAGAPHLMLFWSPTCGYCDAMLDEVRALERRDDLPPLLLVATGDAAANRDQGLRSRTLLDRGFAVTGEALRVAGTPSALRLDAEGRVASHLAVGVDEVLALAGAARG
jgi:peroxiredoxin